MANQQLVAIEPDKEFAINDIIIEPYSISHDAINPVCYTFKSNGKKIGMATDLGGIYGLYRIKIRIIKYIIYGS